MVNLMGAIDGKESDADNPLAKDPGSVTEIVLLYTI